MEIVDRDAHTFTIYCERGTYLVRANNSLQAFQIYTSD